MSDANGFGSGSKLSRGRGFLHPNTIAEASEVIKIFIAAGMLRPSKNQTNAQMIAEAMIKMEKALQVGLTATQGLESIVMMGGKPTIWGAAASAVCMNSPKFGYIREEFDEETMTATCYTFRIGAKEELKRTFSQHDADIAKLWGGKVNSYGQRSSDSPWVTHPRSMLIQRARLACLRANFPECFCGMYATEEMEGIVPGVVIDSINQSFEVTPQLVKKVDSELLSMIKQRIEATQTSEQVIEKWLAKAHVSRLEDLPFSIGEKIADFLTDKMFDTKKQEGKNYEDNNQIISSALPGIENNATVAPSSDAGLAQS